MAIALPRRDAYILGQWGDQCGDVVFAWDHGYVSGYYGQWRGIAGGGCVGAPNVFGGAPRGIFADPKVKPRPVLARGCWPGRA